MSIGSETSLRSLVRPSKPRNEETLIWFSFDKTPNQEVVLDFLRNAISALRATKSKRSSIAPDCKRKPPTFLEKLNVTTSSFLALFLKGIWSIFFSIHSCYVMTTLSSVISSCVERAIHNGAHHPCSYCCWRLGEFTRHVYMYTHAWQGYLFKGYLIIHP